jgi:cysteine desulfurase
MIYFDNNATTALASEVIEKMNSLQQVFGNPSSVHRLGRESRKLIEESRERIAAALRAEPSEICLTSGGTEAIHLALLGRFLPSAGRRHLIVSKVEHVAVLQAAAFLEKFGVEVTYLDVDSQGCLAPEAVEGALRPHTALIAVMFANNEIGNLYPVKKIGELAAQAGVPFFCDAVQAAGKLEIDLGRLPIDLLCGAAHKFHGPKGAGFLYVRDGLKLNPLFHGGRQERGLRAGTENVLGIVGMAEALELALRDLDKDSRRVRGLRDRLQQGILERIPEAVFHGDSDHRVDGTLNFRILRTFCSRWGLSRSKPSAACVSVFRAIIPRPKSTKC